MRRRIALIALIAVITASGCLSPLPEEDEVDHSDRWNTSETVEYFLDDDTFTAIVQVDGYNDTGFEVWERDPFGGDNPVQVAGVRFRNPNGEVTEVDGEDIDTSGDRTVVTLPESEGRIAYIAEKTGTDFTHPTPVEGNVSVHLPPGTDARNFFLGQLSPGGNEVVNENPLVARWESLERGTYITVEYYRRGYPWVLVGTLAVLLTAAVIVVYYYKNVLERLRRRREREDKEP